MKKLSICISTFNRAKFIEKTLSTIVPQLSEQVELIIVDGASSDNTNDIVNRYVKKNKFIKYFKELKNSGVDGDYDKAVSYSEGEFCWLMTDDDFLKPNAIDNVLAKIKKTVDLIIVNSKVMNHDFSKTLSKNQLNIYKDLKYSKNGKNYFPIIGAYLSFIGCVVIRRNLWLLRNRKSYYGTTFIHVGIICQTPPIENIYVISDPLIIIRYGNAMWSSNAFNVWNLMWPRLIWSFDSFSNKDKIKVCRQFPYARLTTLLYYKAMGSFNLNQLRKFEGVESLWKFYLFGIITLLIPGFIINLIFLIYFKLFRTNDKIAIYDLLLSKNNKFF